MTVVVVVTPLTDAVPIDEVVLRCPASTPAPPPELVDDVGFVVASVTVLLFVLIEVEDGVVKLTLVFPASTAAPPLELDAAVLEVVGALVGAVATLVEVIETLGDDVEVDDVDDVDDIKVEVNDGDRVDDDEVLAGATIPLPVLLLETPMTDEVA